MLKAVFKLLKQVFSGFPGSVGRNGAENLNFPGDSVSQWNFEFSGRLGYIGYPEEKLVLS
tara:strand:- start:6589 stop:6768 length:180 start_codon:yes stop_codon:yes gene_type:complete